MSVNPYDPRYRSGFDSYPEDYTNGVLNETGRAARDYMNGHQNSHNPSNRQNNPNPSSTGYTPYGGGGPEGGSGRGWG
jgi:hypothetical protein